MTRAHRRLAALACVALLTACTDGPPAAAPPSAGPARSPSTEVAAPSGAPPTTSRPADDERAAYRAAAARYPGADLDKCGRRTRLTDKACGTALSTAGRVAADTERRLRAASPEHADLLYGGTLLAASAYQDALQQLRDPIPCYGLSDAPEPPPPLRGEAEGICVDAAAIAKVRWRIFLSQVE
jgi:hypothetical protein